MMQYRPTTADYNLADLAEMFGDMPFDRIRHDPPLGTATEEDVLDIDAHEDRLCELETLEGGDVLPGFRLELRSLFADPTQATP